MENEKYGWRGSTDLKQAAMMNIIPGHKLGVAEAIAGVVFLIPKSISSWNTVVLNIQL
jgi:hypothetical protein